MCGRLLLVKRPSCISIIQYIFTLHESAFLCFWTKRRFNTTAVWKMLTNHELVVAWQLLEAVCPVLLTRGGIPQKGLTAQWQSTVRQFVQREVALSFCHIYPCMYSTHWPIYMHVFSCSLHSLSVPNSPSLAYPTPSSCLHLQQVVTNQPVAASFVPTPPKSWLAWSIFSALCCAWPCGLLAIVYSLRVGCWYGPLQQYTVIYTTMNNGIHWSHQDHDRHNWPLQGNASQYSFSAIVRATWGQETGCFSWLPYTHTFVILDSRSRC